MTVGGLVRVRHLRVGSWAWRRSPASTYAYVNPMVAVILGALILGEPLDPRTVLAAAVIIAGVVLIVSGRGRPVRRKSRRSSRAGRAAG
ncbi:MAG: EamA family transporter [Chloroflexota bacterium]